VTRAVKTNEFIRLWKHLNAVRRVQFFLLLLLMILVSVAEIINIGMVAPFLGLLAEPERIYQLPYVQTWLVTFGVVNSTQLLLLCTIVFGVSAIIAGALRLLLLWVSTRISYAAGADISIGIYRRTLYQPYSAHCARNSSEVITGILRKTDDVMQLIYQMLMLFSSAILTAAILSVLMSIEPLISLMAFMSFGTVYLCIVWFVHKKVQVNGKCVARESIAATKALQEGLGGIRDVLINGGQEAYCKIYSRADTKLRRAQGNNALIANSPRYVMEAIGMALIALFAYLLTVRSESALTAIPVLGVLALGAQRLLPVIQQSYSSWIAIKARRAALLDVIELLDQPLPKTQPYQLTSAVSFFKTLALKNVTFRYAGTDHYVLDGISLQINKGDRVGFVGGSGSGKSTLLDIVMGLLIPSAGAVEIDGEALSETTLTDWQKKIAHVPQSIFLADANIAENIAFGLEECEIDFARVKLAAQRAQLSGFIDDLPDGYKTLVGERGVRLSGGQRQRIGIARALYKGAEVIVLDEATSALDTDTEEAVMSAIDRLADELTILIAAHRLSTLEKCSVIIELCDGSINKVGTYADVILKKNTIDKKALSQ
jgi:ABC-type multidrug transport system fused ATPase/permease subunit